MTAKLKKDCLEKRLHIMLSTGECDYATSVLILAGELMGSMSAIESPDTGAVWADVSTVPADGKGRAATAASASLLES